MTLAPYPTLRLKITPPNALKLRTQQGPAGPQGPTGPVGQPARNVYDVMDFGAVGDGVADDTAAIVAALAAMPASGGILNFPVGTFNVTTLDINKPCLMRGMGIITTVVATTKIVITSASGRILISAGAVRVEDLLVTSSIAAGSRTDAGFKCTGPFTQFRNVSSSGHKYGFWIQQGGHQFRNTFANGSASHGFYFDGDLGVGLGEFGLYHCTSTANGGDGFHVRGLATGFYVVRPATFSNTGAGWKSVSAVSGATQDLYISHPAFSVGTGGGVDFLSAGNAVNISIFGGLCEGAGTYGIAIGQNVHTVQLSGLQIDGYGTGLFLDGLSGSIVNTHIQGSTVAQIELGTNSRDYEFAGGGETSSPFGQAPIALKVTGSAGAFRAAAFDFSKATAALSGTIPAGSHLVACPGLTNMPNTRNAQSGNYTLLNIDKNKTIAMTGAFKTLTLNAASGYDADFICMVTNEHASNAQLISAAGGITYGGSASATSLKLYPGQTAILYNQNSAWRIIRPPRWKITAAQTIFVATTGNDTTNDGLTVSTPFLTMQTALNTIINDLDTGGQNVTIQLADGTYSGTLGISPWTGGGNITLQGNTGNKNAVILSNNVAIGVAASFLGTFFIQFLKFTGTTINIDQVSGGGSIFYNNLNFNGAAIYHMRAAHPQAFFTANGAHEISAGATSHIQLQNAARWATTSVFTVTMTGTPNFSGAFINVIDQSFGFSSSLTFSGATTGTRYNVTLNSVLDTAGGGANYFPGNAAGTTATGGQYA